MRIAGTCRSPLAKAEGWFERRDFSIFTVYGAKTLSELLSEARSTIFDLGDDSESEADDGTDDDRPVEPIRLQWQNEKHAIHVDWWTEKSIKPWAGSMKERVILRAMLDNNLIPNMIDAIKQ